MGNGPTTTATAPAPSGVPAAPVTPPPAPVTAGETLTQEQVNAIVARERRAATEAAEARVSEALGMTADEAKTRLAAATAAERAAMTEADRRLAEATEREQKADVREQAAAAREHESNVRDALIAAGVPATKAKGAARLLEVDLGADDTKIASALVTMKAEWPELFTTTTDGTPAAGAPAVLPPSGLPAGRTPTPSDNKNAADGLTRGSDRAKKMQEKRAGHSVSAAMSQAGQ